MLACSHTQRTPRNNRRAHKQTVTHCTTQPHKGQRPRPKAARTVADDLTKNDAGSAGSARGSASDIRAPIQDESRTICTQSSSQVVVDARQSSRGPGAGLDDVRWRRGWNRSNGDANDSEVLSRFSARVLGAAPDTTGPQSRPLNGGRTI